MRMLDVFRTSCALALRYSRSSWVVMTRIVFMVFSNCHAANRPSAPGVSGQPREREVKKVATIIGIALALFAGYVVSHPGGLDKYGCHKDHKTGDYHCH